uniref:Putative secreted protein n=1 Tax=Anopheles triannulatus TaxID=58253 RepID=A0A2M4B6L9_9DIPT
MKTKPLRPRQHNRGCWFRFLLRFCFVPLFNHFVFGGSSVEMEPGRRNGEATFGAKLKPFSEHIRIGSTFFLFL